MRIKVIGGTGYAGSHIVREAVSRGHEVTSYSRNAPAEPVEGAVYRTGNVLEDDFLAETVADADAVFETLSPRGELAGRLEEVVDRLIPLAVGAGVRLGVLGGASSMHVSEGGPRLIDLHEPAPEVAPEIHTGIALLETLRAAPEDLDWFYVSPAASFGSWVPGERTGSYRLSDEVLLTDENGDSSISGADLAIAVVDELEQAAHRRRRFHVAY
ncbi:NAD(P)-dependent oxidoreductase [Naasia aerilata]|uniref:NAD-dependent epimerase n=1 Tax=Naasia aerilata TaxID=1162966 RepID=A0ABN6XM34_9MICO|nr:NAD(P)H-binding protein [Naasia aerilata]BDZ44438.1 NAD-dependent epimerase [Naasia aerilata]